MKKIGLIAIGCSAGGIDALKSILPSLRSPKLPPIVIIQHRGSEWPQILVPFFQEICALPVKEAESKEVAKNGHIYFAPAGYHLLLSDEMTFDLTVEEPVRFSRPSIDVFFESVADIKDLRGLGIILTGANDDGAMGLKKIVDHHGLAIVQDPKEAPFDFMPRAALEQVPQALKLVQQDILRFLLEM